MASTLRGIFLGIDDVKYQEYTKYLLMANGDESLELYDDFEGGAYTYLYNKCKDCTLDYDIFAACLSFVERSARITIRTTLGVAVEELMAAMGAGLTSECNLIHKIIRNLIKAISY